MLKRSVEANRSLNAAHVVKFMEKLFGKDVLAGMFEKIGKGLDKNLIIFVLGGGAMCFRNQKTGTKDLDLVFLNAKDATAFFTCAIKCGFSKPRRLGREYQAMDAYEILENANGFRLDIFSKTVCNALSLSTGMVERSESFGTFGLLEVKLVSNEDVVLFKGITERARDADDIAAVVRTSQIDWDIILQECILQSTMRKWYGLLYNKLAEIEEKHGISSPIMKDLLGLDKKVIVEEAYSGFISKGMGKADALAELKKKGFTKKEIEGL